MKIKSTFATLVMCLVLMGCDTMQVNGLSLSGISSGNENGNYCTRNTGVCVAGAIVAGAIITAIVSNQRGSTHGRPLPSDGRLKEDLKFVKTLDTGVNIYSYHYLGDDRVFLGVIAQEVLEIPQLADAVVTGADGYYRVDYAKLGIAVPNEQAMHDAGMKAVKIADSKAEQ